MTPQAQRTNVQALHIPEGSYNEPYTPAAGRAISPSLGKPLLFFKIHLSAAANVTGRDRYGNVVVAQPHAAGPCPYLWSEVSAVSAGSVWIIHEGITVVDNDDAAMNKPVFNNAIRQ